LIMETFVLKADVTPNIRRGHVSAAILAMCGAYVAIAPPLPTLPPDGKKKAAPRYSALAMQTHIVPLREGLPSRRARRRNRHRQLATA
jgi:hypothetical protein